MEKPGKKSIKIYKCFLHLKYFNFKIVVLTSKPNTPATQNPHAHTESHTPTHESPHTRAHTGEEPPRTARTEKKMNIQVLTFCVNDFV